MDITSGHDEDGDLALIFKVTAELIKSKLSVCSGKTYVFSQNNTSFWLVAGFQL